MQSFRSKKKKLALMWKGMRNQGRDGRRGGLRKHGAHSSELQIVSLKMLLSNSKYDFSSAIVKQRSN